ncbi:MAG: LysR family transcriptional regulator, partial [Planctomycetota bacterium]
IMDLGQLRYFVKIVEHQSFTRAAKDCNVSQPALSQQIAKLEKELEQPLFERQGRTIRLTAAGHVLQKHAEQILQMVEDARRQITDDGQTGRICMSAIPTIGPYLLPELLKKVGEQFPKASFEINEDVTGELLKRCSNGDIDIGIVALPAAAKYLTIEPLFEEELVLAIAADHPLAGKNRIQVKDIQQEPFVLLGGEHCLSDSIEAFCNRQSFQPVATSRIQQMETVRNLVAIGNGISFLPKMATRTSNDDRIVYRSLVGEMPTRTIAMCWNPYRYQSQLLTNFLKGIRELSDPGMAGKIQLPQQKVNTRKNSRKVAR